MTPTNPTDAQMKLADVTDADRKAAAWALDLAPNSQTWETLTAAHRTPDQIWQANRVAQAFAHHRLATEARAQGLVDALEAMLHAVCHETGFANAVRNDSGVAYPWEPLDIVEASARQALATWRRT